MCAGRRPGKGWRVAAVSVTVLMAAQTACGGPPSTAKASVPGDTKVLVALELKGNSAGLDRVADGAADPSNSEFGKFTTLASIASTFGAPLSAIDHDLALLDGWGIDLSVDATHGALWGEVTADQASAHFGTPLVETGGVIEPMDPPTVPAGLEDVTGVVGLSRTATGAPSTQTTQPKGIAPCSDAIETEASIASRFGFTQIVPNANGGSGTTVDIVALHGVVPTVFTEYATCSHEDVSFTGSVHQVPLTTTQEGGPEVALDSIMLSLLAPKAKLNVFQFDANSPIAFPLLDLLTKTRSTPNVMDITVDFCETEMTAAAISLSEWLLAAIAATGTSVVVASGDSGSSGCYPDKSAPSVGYPASSQFVTAMGGVSYSGSAEAHTDLTSWNDKGTYGSGGGTSTKVHAPEWQGGTWRRVPDVAAEADPGSVGSIPVCTSRGHCAWESVGGTSVSATVLSAAALLAASYGTGVQRWGNLAPRLWRHGTSDRAVIDVTTGTNMTYSSSCCRAATGYDTVTGWGLFLPNEVISVLGGHGAPG